jgi:hypothetical protein
MMRARTGAALLEILVAAALAALVVTSAALLLHAQSRAAHATTQHSERSDAARTALLTLAAEWRTLVPQSDIYGIAADSVAGRIFRGVAVVCASSATTSLVRYRGLRLPDPAKDSALELGLERTVAVTAIAADTGCTSGPGEHVLAVDWGVQPASGSMWLFFESGSYHLSTNALRYRRAPAGRQPITNEVLSDASSAFTTIADSVLRAVDVMLADRWSPRTARARIYLLNSR